MQNQNTKEDKEKKEADGKQFSDIEIECRTCQNPFKWSAKEQQYYQKMGYKKKPQKCSHCREKANKLREQSMFYVHCAFCKNDAVFLSPPPKDRVAICSKCYSKLLKKYSGASTNPA